MTPGSSDSRPRRGSGGFPSTAGSGDPAGSRGTSSDDDPASTGLGSAASGAGPAGAAARTGRRGPGRPRDPEADTAILEAALALFVERGFEGMSMDQVAKRAGVAKLTLYRRWRSKEQLVAQAMESARRPMPAEATVEEIERVGLARYVEQTLDAQVEMMTRPGFRAMIARLLGSTVSHPELLATSWKEYVTPRRQVTHVLLEHAKEAGRIPRGTDSEVLIDMIVGAVIYRLLQPDPPDPERLRSYLEAVYRQAGLLA